MFPPRHFSGRYLRAARRAHLARIAAVGAAVVLPAACGGSDADVFGASATSVPAGAAEAVTTTSVTSDEVTEATATTEPVVAATDTPAVEAAADEAATTEPVASTASGTFPAGGEMIVEFTYSASSEGRVHNPYVAVWVEDADGNLVSTVGVWYEQSGQGSRWLSDLRQWSAASGGDVVASVTGATRTPGSYALVWDGTDDTGAPVAHGEYVLFVESAREHGPYQITSAAITVSDDGFEVELPDDGELVDLTATLTV